MLGTAVFLLHAQAAAAPTEEIASYTPGEGLPSLASLNLTVAELYDMPLPASEFIS
jgi:hypothetical protein